MAEGRFSDVQNEGGVPVEHLVSSTLAGNGNGVNPLVVGEVGGS